MHGCLLNWKASIVRRLCFLTQFMRSQGFLFFEVISWILSLKKLLLVILTVLLKDFQSSIDFEDLYLLSFVWHLSFHQSLVHLVILTTLECLYHIDSNNLVYSWTIFSSTSLSKIIVVSSFPKTSMMRSTMKFSSSSLFLMIVEHSSWINSSLMEMLTVNGAWSDGNRSSGCTMWLLSSLELWRKKNKLITELLLLMLLEYLVGTCWFQVKSHYRLNEKDSMGPNYCL